MGTSRRRRSRAGFLPAVLLVVSACTGGSADTTTSSSPASSTTSTTSTTTTTTTTMPPTPNGPGLIFEGDSNETVEAFQFYMNCNGYGPIEVDGVFGPNTRGVIEQVQGDLGREVTGVPDEETLAILARNCDDDRRVTVDEEDAGEEIMVGNATAEDAERFFVRAIEGVRMAIVVSSPSGDAVVSVRGADGGAVGPGATRAWAVDIDVEQDYVVEVSSLGDPVTFVATFAIGEVDIETVEEADANTIVLDGAEEAVVDVCLDTTGETAFVAETGAGHLVVSAGSPGRFAIGQGGVGAPIEFVYEDGSPGFVGFAIDFDVDVGDQVEGSGPMFGRGPGGLTDPVDLAFAFDRSAAPCEGGEGIAVVLSATGLGVADFGDGADETLGFVRSALPGASPTEDTGWLTIDNQSNEFGICRDGTTEIRAITVDNLTMYFTDAGTSFAPAGTRHFAAYTASDGVFPFQTANGVGPGSTVSEVLDAHPDSVPADGLSGGIDVYISSPPGSDRWLRATAVEASGPDDLDAVITSVSGGRFCDL